MKKSTPDPEALRRKLNQDYQTIQHSIHLYFGDTDQSYCQYLLTDLILLVLDHITPKEGIFRKEVNNLMRGHSISTPTTISFDQGFKIGKEQGFQHETQSIISLIKDETITLHKAAAVLHMPEEELQKKI